MMKVPRSQDEIILVVDDEPAICWLVKILLEHAGYAVLVAGDAESNWPIAFSEGSRKCGCFSCRAATAPPEVLAALRSLSREPSWSAKLGKRSRASRGHRCGQQHMGRKSTFRASCS